MTKPLSELSKVFYLCRYFVRARQDSLLERAQHYFSGIDQAELGALQQQLDLLRGDRAQQLKQATTRRLLPQSTHPHQTSITNAANVILAL